jgi:ubiquinol-cytochrome c reductase cytochrome b subunit
VRPPLAALADWLDHRTGFRTIRRYLLDEPLPAGTGWWFTLGSLLLFGLGIQVVTGIALALYYAPTPDHAWDSVRYITTDVRGGSFLRGLHHWGASLVVVAALLHLVRVVLFGSYRRPREVNWVVGLLLLLVILAFGLTGYLLPWDQRAYWATVVTVNVSKLTPLLGEWIAQLLMGGPQIGALTLTRWYAAHVLILPVVLLGLVVLHLYLMRRHGISGPLRFRPGPARPFFPYQAFRDVTVSLAAGLVLAWLAWMGAPALEPPADPTSSDYTPRPEWYFLGLFELLKYFPGRWEIVGAVVIPGLVFTGLVLLPWLDRSGSRKWRGRRVVLATFVGGLAAATALTVRGAMDRPVGATGEWTIPQLAGASLVATDRCTSCHHDEGVAAPIEAGTIGRPQDWLAAHVADPLTIAPGLREPPETDEEEIAAIVAALARMRVESPPAQDPETARALLIFNRECIECHRVNGVGGAEGPDLTHIGQELGFEEIQSRVIDPFNVDWTAEMPAFGDKLSPEEIRTVAAWVASLE